MSLSTKTLQASKETSIKKIYIQREQLQLETLSLITTTDLSHFSRHFASRFGSPDLLMICKTKSLFGPEGLPCVSYSSRLVCRLASSLFRELQIVFQNCTHCNNNILREEPSNHLCFYPVVRYVNMMKKFNFRRSI